MRFSFDSSYAQGHAIDLREAFNRFNEPFKSVLLLYTDGDGPVQQTLISALGMQNVGIMRNPCSDTIETTLRNPTSLKISKVME